MSEIIGQFPWFSYVAVFGALVALVILFSLPFFLLEALRRQRDLIHGIYELIEKHENFISKITPLIDAESAAFERTKDCPECNKKIDEAYGRCPFCGHEFSKKYFLSIIGPGEEGRLDDAAKRLAGILKADFHDIKHRLRMGFDYSVPDHAKRREFMSLLEKMGCTVKEIVKWT